MTLTDLVLPRSRNLPELPSLPRVPFSLHRRVALLGPAFVAAVAYVDPGNFATNLQGGAAYGYQLVWVVVLANLMAMVVQYLSAKAGMATGKSLPELCRDAFPRRSRALLWLQAEVVAMATDLAEFVGAALALNLLFGVPMFPAGLITAVVAFIVLACQRRGCRRFEIVVSALFGLILLGLGYDLLVAGNHSASGFASGLVPSIGDGNMLLLITGIIGATVMPHAIYVHSALTRDRREEDMAVSSKAERLRFMKLDCGIGLGLAGMINLAMLCTAAALFHNSTWSGVDSIEAAHAGLGQLIGGAGALAFAVALLASGLSSSSVGTYAGQVVMQGFLNREIPLVVRRGVTMLPALVVLGLGLPVTDTLVLSQVVLSFGIPFALVPLILITRRKDVMGAWVNQRRTTMVASAIAAVIIAMNVQLLASTFLG